MNDGPVKRSITIAGHATSVSLEPDFWDALHLAARDEGIALAALVARIDEARSTNLASAIRVWLLRRAGQRPSAPDRPRVTGVNHLTLAVADVARSLAFYRDLLDCVPRARWNDGAYLEAGGLWLCLSRDPLVRTAPHPDYSHIAFDVAAAHFDALADRIRAVAPIWKDNGSEGASLYFLDPDGHKLELHAGTLASRLADFSARGRPVTLLA